MQNQIILAIIELFLYFALGAFAGKLKAIKEEEISRLSSLVIRYFYSLYIFSTMVKGFEWQQLQELWSLPFISIGIMLVGTAVSIPAQYALTNRTPQLVGSFKNICAMNNFGFLPIIIISRLWGDVGVSQLFIMLLGAYVGYWTIGILLFGTNNLKEIPKKLLNPAIISILLGLLIKGFGINRYIPSVFMDFSEKIGSGAVPLILVITGANLRFSILKFKKGMIWNLVWFGFLRIFLIPAILILILYLLPLPRRVFQIAAIIALMPSSTMSTLLSRLYGGDPDFSAQAAVVTHLLAMITVPIGLSLLRIAEG